MFERTDPRPFHHPPQVIRAEPLSGCSTLSTSRGASRRQRYQIFRGSSHRVLGALCSARAARYPATSPPKVGPIGWVSNPDPARNGLSPEDLCFRTATHLPPRRGGMGSPVTPTVRQQCAMWKRLVLGLTLLPERRDQLATAECGTVHRDDNRSRPGIMRRATYALDSRPKQHPSPHISATARVRRKTKPKHCGSRLCE